MAQSKGAITIHDVARSTYERVSLQNNSITDGVIIVTPTATTFATNAPVVAVDPNNESPDCPAVIATNRAGALSAMKYLTQLSSFMPCSHDISSAVSRWGL